MDSTLTDNHENIQTMAFGPLRYRFVVHDTWGQQMLNAINEHIACRVSNRFYTRIIHLRQLLNLDQQASSPLPLPLAELLSRVDARMSWHCTNNLVNCVWTSPDSQLSFWTREASNHIGTLRFHLPWSLIISDCIARGGGLAHAGLAKHADSGILLLAPPGGGKTSTLKTAPSGWTVLSDDAALFWRGPNGGWQASPIPAWGNLTSQGKPWLYHRLKTGAHDQVKNIICLEKSKFVSLEKIPPSGMVPTLYRALCEFPVTILAEAIQQESLFRIAAQASRELESWRLTMPLHGNVWPLLSKVAT